MKKLNYRDKNYIFNNDIVVLCCIAHFYPGHAQDFAYLKWQKQVVDKIIKNQRYPRSAVSRGIEGRAQARLVVEKTGKIKSFEITKETGESVLDREILRVLSRIAPLPPVPGADKDVMLTIPLIWSLM